MRASPNVVTTQGPSAPSFGIRALSLLRHRRAKNLLDWVLPRACLACGDGLGEEPANLGLCHRCFQQLEPAPRPACLGCGQPLPGEASEGPGEVAKRLCLSCLPSPPAFDEILVDWSYEAPLDHVILGLKHRRLDYLGEALGRHLVARFESCLETVDLVVPVPTAWWRRLRRGYNQAERIARPVARRLGLPVKSVLRRSTFRRPQQGLQREARLKNLRAAFRCPVQIEGQRVLLIDDVATTGATLDAAARALKSAGAHRVVGLVAARRGPFAPSRRNSSALRLV